ncbi:hypothetical protein VULLAG_LOCUS9135 [Vulpes lagopus]
MVAVMVAAAESVNFLVWLPDLCSDSRGRDAQQNGLPEWIYLVIHLRVFSRRATSCSVWNQPPGLLSRQLHLQFHGSLVSRSPLFSPVILLNLEKRE